MEAVQGLGERGLDGWGQEVEPQGQTVQPLIGGFGRRQWGQVEGAQGMNRIGWRALHKYRQRCAM